MKKETPTTESVCTLTITATNRDADWILAMLQDAAEDNRLGAFDVKRETVPAKGAK